MSRQDNTDIQGRLERLAAEARMLFLAGLPGTGKSLLAHTLAHLAHAGGHTVHLLQWDVARPVFEATPAGRRYPMVRGVTHPVIRKAAGVWARQAVGEWDHNHRAPAHVLVGEAPLVGHRFIELARPAEDAAERVLAADSCRFVLPVPSAHVRRFIEAERVRRTARRQHARESEDAPPHVVRELWDELVRAAGLLGLDEGRSAAGAAYDPDLYESVYQRVLAHRGVETLPVTEVMSTAASSVYQFAVPTHDIVPTPEEAGDYIRAVEERYPDPDVLRRETERWYLV